MKRLPCCQRKKTLALNLERGPFVRAIPNRSDEGLTLEMSAFKLFTVANLRFQLNW